MANIFVANVYTSEVSGTQTRSAGGLLLDGLNIVNTDKAELIRRHAV